MKKIIQIELDHEGDLFVLTEDGKIFYRAGEYGATYWKEVTPDRPKK